MNFIQFITTRTFVRHFAISVAIVVALVWLTLMLLGSFTLHGVTVTVPRLVALTMDKVDQLESAHDFDIRIVDSVFNPSKEPGTVLSQDPPPGSSVKKGRTLYIAISSRLPEMISMPDLHDLSLRQAKALLQTYGLSLGGITYTPNADRNVILGQYYGGASLKAGQPIRKGSIIDLAVGSGRGPSSLQVPFLIGMERTEAIATIQRMGLIRGEESFTDGADSLNARVYQQDPEYIVGKQISAGSMIHLVYKPGSFDFDSYIHTLKIDTLKQEEPF